jgi:hypothetical protein
VELHEIESEREVLLERIIHLLKHCGEELEQGLDTEDFDSKYFKKAIKKSMCWNINRKGLNKYIK